MNGFDIILIALIAGFILLRLRSELGNKTGNEPRPGTQDIRSILTRQTGARTSGPNKPASVIDLTSDPVLREGYKEIRSADGAFDPAQFLEGARSIYPMILDAFWSGDKATLEQFVDTEILEQFVSAIDVRADRGDLVEARVVDLKKADVQHARMHGAMAEIIVSYEADIVSVTRDQDGEIIDGNPSDTIVVKDIWTFSRNAKASDPNWTLVATRTG